MALTLNGTTGIAGIAGSAGTPALQGNNDTNTGYFFATDTLGLSTAGSERLRIEADGHIQIGLIGLTGGNDQALTITEPGGSANVLELATANSSGRINFSRNLSSTLNTTSYIEWTEPGAQGTGELRFGTSTGSNNPIERFRITSTGQVYFPGTGAGSGSRGLEIATESVGAADEGVIFNARASGTTGRLTFKTNSATAMTILGNGGNIGIGNTSPGELLSLRHATSNTVLDFECLAANDGTTGNIIKFRGKGANGVSYHASQIKGITENGANNAGFLSFWTNSAGTVAERLRIDSSGNLWLNGNGSYNTDRQVFNADGTSGLVEATNELNIFQNKSSSGGLYIGYKDIANGGTITDYHFYTGQGNDTKANISCEYLMTKGVDFGVTSHGGSMTSEVLDDYEEGTFQANIKFGGASANIAHNEYVGRYTKIGRFVTCTFIVGLTNKGTSTGTASINGLPFTSTDDSQDRMSGYATYYGGMSSIDSQIILYNTTNATKIDMYDSNATYIVAVTDANFTNSSHLRGIIQYHCS